MLLKQEADEDDLVERMKNFEEADSVAGKTDDIKAEPKPQIKQEERPGKESNYEIQKGKEWLEDERQRTSR